MKTYRCCFCAPGFGPYLLIGTLSLWLSPIFSQHTPSFSPGREAPRAVPLVQVLQQLHRQQRVSFLYEPAVIEEKKVLQHFRYEDDVQLILQNILPPLNLTYERAGRQNFIIKKARRPLAGIPAEIKGSHF